MIPIPSLTPLLAGAALAAALAAGAAGWKVAAWRCDAARVASVERAIAQAEEIARQDAEIIGHHAARAAATEAHFGAVRQEVIRYVQTHPDPVDCLDADGLRVWADANAGAPDATGRPDYSLSSPAAARVRAIRQSIGQSRRDRAALSPVPGPALGPVGLGQPQAGVTP